MKVLQTIPGLSAKSGGPSTCTHDLMEGLMEVSNDLSIDLLTLANPDTIGKGRPWLKELENDYKKPFFFSLKAREFMRSNDYDLFHCNALWMGLNHDTCRIAREKGKPYIISPHGMLYPTALNVHAWKKHILLNTWYNKDIHSATCIHATCQQEAGYVRKFGYKGPIAIIPNPVVFPEEIEVATSKPKEKSIGFLGRLHPIKKVENIFYGAVKAIKDGCEPFTIEIMGKGDDKYEEFLRNEAERLGIADNVHFVGFVSGKEKYDRLANLWALMVPSVQENFGMIVPEALICGTPVYASLGTPWSELEPSSLQGGDGGRLRSGWWKDNSPETIANVIHEIMEMDESQCLAMGANGRRLIEEKYEQKKVALMMSDLYDWILNKRLNPIAKPEFVYLNEEPIRKSKLKVLTFITGIDLGSGGPSRSVPMLVKGLAEANVDITLMTFRSDNMNSHALDGTTAKLKIWDKGTSSQDIEEFILNEGFNLIQMQSMWDWSYHKVAKIARKHNIPYIITPRGMLEPWSLNQKKLKKRLGLMVYQMNDMKKAACIFTTAEMEAQHVRDMGIDVPISVIPNGIETEGYPCRTSMDGVKKQILFLSRIHVKKGIEILIDAFSHLHAEFPEWKVVIVGNGEAAYIASLKRKVSDMGMSDCIDIKEPIFGEAKVKVYQESSIFCLPSYSENFGMVIAEAMSCGVPVITTTNCPWEFINGASLQPSPKGEGAERYGWCVELSIENIKNALRDAMAMDASTLYDMGQRGSKLVNDTYNYHSVAKKTKELYERLIYKINNPSSELL